MRMRMRGWVKVTSRHFHVMRWSCITFLALVIATYAIFTSSKGASNSAEAQLAAFSSARHFRTWCHIISLCIILRTRQHL